MGCSPDIVYALSSQPKVSDLLRKGECLLKETGDFLLLNLVN